MTTIRVLQGDEARAAIAADLAKLPSLEHCLSVVTPKAGRDVLGWAREEGGWSTGDFTRALIQACALADVDNLARLERSFPALVCAWRLYSHHHGGLALLREIAEREPMW